MRRNHAIDAMRCYAVLLVLGYHFFPDLLPGGYLGVDVFFVLSGLFIARNLGDGRDFSALSYLVRRLVRLGPALVFVLAATLAISWWLLLPQEYIVLAREVLIGGAFLTNIFPVAGDYFGPRVDEAALAHLWSLGVEAQIYLASALLLPFLIRIFRPLPAYVGLFLASYGCMVVLGDEANSFYNPALRFWEFALGALVAHAAPLVAPKAARRMGAIGLPILAVTPFVDLGGAIGSWSILPAAAAALLLLAACTSTVRVPAAIAFLGLSSYAIYLWHWPLLVLWGYYDLGQASTAEASILLAASISLGCATYWFVERPILACHQQRRIGKLILAAIFLVVVSAFLVDASRGAPSRLPAPALAVLDATERSHPDLMRCHSIYPGNIIPATEACRHNADSGPAKIALWGDSHAAALAGGLIRAGVDFKEFSYSGCPPLPGFHVDIRGLECRDHAEASYRSIVEDESIQVVIIHARWPIYLDTIGPAQGSMPGIADQGRLIDRSGRRATPEDGYLYLKNMVRDLAAAGKNVVLITPTPAFAWDLKASFARAAWHSWGDLPHLTQDAYRSYAQHSISYLQDIAKSKGVQLIDAGEIFCPGDLPRCPTHDAQGHLLTVDEDHLSATAADLLAQHVLDAIGLRNSSPNSHAAFETFPDRSY